jgi:gliding motility-associated-like protein
MIRKLPFLCISIFYLNTIFGQTFSDTAEYPYWVDMMQDRSINLNQTKRAFETYWQNRTIEKGSGWKAFKRWEWMAEKTVDSLGNFPDVISQINQLNQMIKEDEKRFRLRTLGLGPGNINCKTRGDWKEFGPIQLPNNNTGQMNGMGRLNAVAIHPTDSNTIFAGACAGGIWKSTDGGKTWKVYSDSLPTLGVSSIAFDNNNPNIMYMGTGDRDAGDAAGFGVFKSINGGNSWFQSNTGMGNRVVGRLIVSPSNTNVLLAATNNGVYRSTNAGANWTQMVTGNFKDIIFKPNNPNVVYATRDGILFRSLNNGVTWVSITNGLPTTAMSRGVIDVNVNMPNLVYFWLANGSVNKGFYLSRDSGTTFVTKSTTPNLHDWSTNGSGTGGQAWYDKDMVTDPLNPAIIYVGGVNVFRSNDTGQTWTIAGYWVNQVHADQHELIACPLTKRIFVANDGGLYYSRNRGASWIPVKSGLAIAQIYKMDCSRTQKDILINGYQDNGTGNFFNNDWYTTRGGDGMDCEIDQMDNRYSYGELYYGSIFRVFNVHTQATIAANGTNGINEEGGWVTPFILKEGSSNTMYIGYKNIWRSDNIRNSPPTWTKISNNLGGTNSINFTEVESNIANPDIFYASRSNGTFYRSDDVNAVTPTWTNILQPVAGTITAIETDPKWKDVVYIGIGTRVYRSKNKGTSWTQIASNLSHNVNCILLDTSSSKKGIYVGTNGGGVWYSDTTANVWRYYSQGMPHSIRVTDLELYYDNNPICKNHILYASTYNRGNWFGPVMNEGNELPVARIFPYDTSVCQQTIVDLKSDACNVPGRFKWEISGGNYQFVNGTDTFSKNVSLQFGQRGEYRFKFMAENCNGIDTLEGFLRVADTVIKASCTPITTSFADSRYGIFSVELNGVKNESLGRLPEGAYMDYSCSKVIQLKRGKKYALKVLTGAAFNEQVKAFIDFNNNGVMNDPGELVFQPAAAIQFHSDSILIPMNATINSILRMRVRSDRNSTGTNPCTNLSYGQTEDYGVIIVDSIFPKFSSNQMNRCLMNEFVFSDSTETEGWQYTWTFGDGAIPATANTRGPHIVKYATPGNKTVSLTIDGFEKSMDSFVVVHQFPDVNIQSILNDTSLCVNETFKIQIIDNNNLANKFKWYFNGALIADSIQSTLARLNVTMTDSGSYSVIASSDYCSDTAAQILTVHQNPVVDYSVNVANQCFKNNSFVFANNSSVANSSLSYTWLFDDNTSTTTISPTKNYASFGVYDVKLIALSNHLCSDSTSKTMNVYENAVPDFDITEDSVCFKGNSFEFINSSTLSSGTMDYEWQFGDGTSSILENPAPKKYAIFVNQHLVKLIVNTNQNCRDTISKSVYLNPSPTANFTISNDKQCLLNNIFNFTNTSNISAGTMNSEWAFGDASASNIQSPNHTYATFGNYDVQLIAVSNHLCKDTVVKSVEVFQMPLADFTINDNEQCLLDNSFDFSDISNAGIGHSRDWTILPNTSLSNTATINHVFSTDGDFDIRLIVTTSNLCKDTITKDVLVVPSPDFTIEGSTKFCINEPIVLNANSIDNSLVYTWKLGTNPVFIGNPFINNTPKLGSYNLNVVGVNTYGCETELNLPNRVSVFSLPVPMMDTSVKVLENGIEVTFDDITPIVVNNRTWSTTPIVQNGNSKQLIMNLSDSVRLNVLLMVTDTNNCTGSTIKSYFLTIPNMYYFPSSFSPNGDGFNDVFKIMGYNKVNSFKLEIFNRWGEIVFETNDPVIGWDGKSKGEFVQQGDYIYMIKIEDINKRKIYKKGVVSVLR